MIAIKAFFKKNKAPLAERDTRCQRRCGLVLGYTLLRRGSRRQPSVSGARGCRLMLQAKGGTHANWTTDIDKKRPRSRAGRSLVKVFWRTGFCKIQELGSGKPGHRPQHALNERTSDEADATPKERGSQVFFFIYDAQQHKGVLRPGRAPRPAIRFLKRRLARLRSKV